MTLQTIIRKHGELLNHDDCSSQPPYVQVGLLPDRRSGNFKAFHINGADGRSRTGTAFATAPSRQRVYQFHHIGYRKKQAGQQLNLSTRHKQFMNLGSGLCRHIGRFICRRLSGCSIGGRCRFFGSRRRRHFRNIGFFLRRRRRRRRFFHLD
jgi:hypothetical protein